MIPISICTSEDPTCTKLKVLLDGPEMTVTLNSVTPEQWVKVGSHDSFILNSFFQFRPWCSAYTRQPSWMIHHMIRGVMCLEISKLNSDDSVLLI